MTNTGVRYLMKVLQDEFPKQMDNIYCSNQLLAEHICIKANEIEAETSQKYAEFCVECDRNGMPLLDFKSWIEL